MMKCIYRLVLPGLLLATAMTTTTYADDGLINGQQQQGDEDIQKLVKYLGNLGTYLGYDLTADLTPAPSPSKEMLDHKLLNIDAMKVMQNYLFNSMLGSIPVNTFSNAFELFVPSNNQGYSPINAFANATFKTPPYSTPAQNGTISANTLIDQQTSQSGQSGGNFLQDPVSQAVFNILGTPDLSYCLNNAGDTWQIGCPQLQQKTSSMYQSQVMNNVVGDLPGPLAYFTYEYNQQFISQLNSNTLISPLLYTTTSDSQTSPSTKTLTAQSQAEQAANFIRYATGAVAPLALPQIKDYKRLFSAATVTQDGKPTLAQMQAQATLDAYLTSLRVYAAQSSVGISNLYYMLSKRLPQNESVSENPLLTSQALSEFTMATWRLYNPADTDPSKKQWLDKINDASSATLQKEMVTLLAEINYQLYLNRQQEERLLLTNTMLLLQNARASQPTASSLAPGATGTQ